MQFDYRDSRPIYVQLVERLRDQILAGVLAEGDRLPSVRELAGQLAINPNTIGRAYRELENDGWVISVPGKGVFVRDGKAPSSAHRKQLMEKLDGIIHELESAGMSRAEIITHLEGGTNHA